jgi:hypothetical protein
MSRPALSVTAKDTPCNVAGLPLVTPCSLRPDAAALSLKSANASGACEPTGRGPGCSRASGRSGRSTGIRSVSSAVWPLDSAKVAGLIGECERVRENDRHGVSDRRGPRTEWRPPRHREGGRRAHHHRRPDPDFAQVPVLKIVGPTINLFGRLRRKLEAPCDAPPRLARWRLQRIRGAPPSSDSAGEPRSASGLSHGLPSELTRAQSFQSTTGRREDG